MVDIYCPHCGSREIHCNYTETDFDNGVHWDSCTCRICGGDFKIEYHIAAIHKE